MLNEIIKTAEELNTAALHYRQSGNMDGVRELAKAHAVSKKQTEEFIQGSRYRLVDIPIEERTFANASEKLRAEMFALKDAGFADIIGQYLVNLAKTDSALDAQVLKKHKMLQRCLDYVTQKAYNIALEGAKKKGENGIRANTGLALSGDQVFPWVLEYYAKDDEREIVSKESYILFLREKENPKVPFYTLEVEPDGTIRQKRAEFNRQNKDIDKVTSFLTLWQKEIQKRLTKKDRKSTEESRKLRQQNYQEIRDKHVVVHGGTFAGELLADLLEKDLMDLPVESAENEESPTEIAA